MALGCGLWDAGKKGIEQRAECIEKDIAQWKVQEDQKGCGSWELTIHAI